jgi:8-oxo-dGTP pyrophosphatase MutT (NUDIX family)
MPNKQDDQSSAGVKVETLDQISAGRVAFRWQDSDLEVAIVSVRPKLRWQLPKGIVDPGESPQVTIAHVAIVEDIIPAGYNALAGRQSATCTPYSLRSCARLGDGRNGLLPRPVAALKRE